MKQEIDTLHKSLEQTGGDRRFRTSEWQSDFGAARTRPRWESLEALVREAVQGLQKRVLIEEVSEFLGQERCERRLSADAKRRSRKLR
jgi:hypothetical protein